MFLVGGEKKNKQVNQDLKIEDGRPSGGAENYT